MAVRAYINGIRVIPYEEEEQTELFSWAAAQESVHPELRLMFHIPNGGKRGKAEAARFKAAGVKAGVPDICLPVARRGFHALYIELKAMDGRPSLEQNEWMIALLKQGNYAQTCYGFDSAIRLILWYLEKEAEV